MAKIWTTLAAGYLKGRWGAWEFIREMVQNGRDAEVEHGAKLTVEWKNGTLRIENEGCTLPIKALLQGYTTKAGKADLIGKFGEGFSLGLVAGLREGFDIKIRNGSEVWVPSAERSEQFGEDVLVMNVSTGREYQNRVRVEVGGVTKEAWDLMKGMFLFLPRKKEVPQIQTHAGTLLTGEECRGQVFVKGIFVQSAPDALYGYDFQEVELDRDRKMIEGYDLRYRAKEVLLAALGVAGVSVRAALYEAMTSPEPSLETSAIGRYDAIHKATVEYVASRFAKDHGENAIPVSNLAEAKDVEHFGKKGVVVSAALAAVLAHKIGDFAKVKDGLAREVVSTYHRDHLSVREREVLDETLSLLGDVTTVGEVTVVTFRSESLLGQFVDGRTLIARKCLDNFEECLATVLHEVAHRAGDDGDHAHIARVEQLWKGVVRVLRFRQLSVRTYPA